MADIIQIGANIRSFREKKGLTQRALADNVLVSFQAISAWERGLSIPDLENAVRLAEYFGVSVDTLLSQRGQDFFVGIHGDSKKTEFVLFEKSGTVKNVVCLEGSNPNDRDLEHTVWVLVRGLETVLSSRMPKMIFAGLAGASQNSYQKAIAAQLSERFNTKAAVGWDATDVLSLGADPENSIAVICGTGSCVFARKGGQEYHYGGWGHLFDQAGSAYDVGKDAIRCALAQEDGIGNKSLLTDLVHDALQGNAFDNISTIYKNGSAYIAGFADLVLQAAGKGDTSAQNILQENAKRLAQLIRTAISQHGMPGQIIAAGSFLKKEPFRTLVEQQTGVILTMPDIEPVYGACIEALRAEGSPVPEGFHERFLESYKLFTA